MAEKEKAKVIEYRTLGFGYKKISQIYFENRQIFVTHFRPHS